MSFVRTATYYLPLALYAIFVIVMIIGFVYMARYRNCMIKRYEDPHCFTDWQCQGDNDETDPVQRFKDRQRKCGAKAVTEHIRQNGGDDISTRECAALQFINSEECRDSWKHLPSHRKNQITEVLENYKDTCNLDLLRETPSLVDSQVIHRLP